MAALFSERAYVERWLEVEDALAAVQADLGLIPADAAVSVSKGIAAADIDLFELRNQTEVVGYPIFPLLRQLAARSDPAVGHYVHWGATTQDIMDTGLVLMLRAAAARVDLLIQALGDHLCALAEQHAGTVMAGRTHGQQAVPTTLGAKIAVWLDETARGHERAQCATRRVLVVQLFGAAGTAAALGPRSREVRAALAWRLEIGNTDVPWHSSRDRLAELGFALAAITSTCGRIAREVIELSRTEIAEVLEQGRPGHGASSTMPQKQNPSRSEAIVGMALTARQHVGTLLGAMTGTHERSAGEWQAEWDTIPMLFALAASCLVQTDTVLSNLRVYPEAMRANLALDSGLVMAEAAMMALADTHGRHLAHRIVTEASAAARERNESLGDVLARDPAVCGTELVDSTLDPSNYLGEADVIVASAMKHWTDLRQKGTNPREGRGDKR